jgi:hypothetical protein
MIDEGDIPSIQCKMSLCLSKLMTDSLYNLGTDPIENIASNSSLLWRYVFVAAETCLPRRGNMFSLPEPRSGRLLLLNFSGRSAPFGTAMSMVVVAKVHRFVQSGI